MNPESILSIFRFFMSTKLNKHEYAKRLKYMHMLEEVYNIKYIHKQHGIGKELLGYL